MLKIIIKISELMSEVKVLNQKMNTRLKTLIKVAKKNIEK